MLDGWNPGCLLLDAARCVDSSPQPLAVMSARSSFRGVGRARNILAIARAFDRVIQRGSMLACAGSPCINGFRSPIVRGALIVMIASVALAACVETARRAAKVVSHDRQAFPR
ncbi:hypothetical protein ACNRBS_19570 [Ralstonia pseudosolanacearum]|uniref:hypothetical protein n=1 Tax=Ralstonia pseudosolanacearum TaxID=1310165 RepID=UPI001E5B7C64|nr:hypothetical protein [Ralstonia pseudosolanacearum]